MHVHHARQQKGSMMTRPIHEIALEITLEWHKPYFGAVPYLNAMYSLNALTDDFYADSGKEIVLYFLSNATTWRGEAARRIKAEFKQILKGSTQ